MSSFGREITEEVARIVFLWVAVFAFIGILFGVAIGFLLAKYVL